MYAWHRIARLAHFKLLLNMRHSGYCHNRNGNNSNARCVLANTHTTVLTHACTHTHTHTHMHTHKHTHTYTYTHTHTHNLHRYQVSGGFDGICCPRSCCLCRASSSSIHFIGCQPASFGVGAGPRDGSLGGVVCLSISSIIRCSLSSCKGMSMVQVCVSYRSMCASKAIRLE